MLRLRNLSSNYVLLTYDFATACYLYRETIYVGYLGSDWHGELKALNPDGTEKWNISLSATLRLFADADYSYSSPAMDPDGTIYGIVSDFNTNGAKLYAFGAPTKPDLEIVEKLEEWVDETHYNVTYVIHNNGTATAPAGHHTTLYVDGVPMEHKHVPVVLEPCETYTDTFDTVIECTDEFDTIKVCADNDEVVDELDEDNNCLENELPCQHPLWQEINKELDSLKGNVSAATMPSIIQRRLVDKLEYAKELKDNAKIECEAGNFEASKKKLGVAKCQVESFASMVKITRRISPKDKLLYFLF